MYIYRKLFFIPLMLLLLASVGFSQSSYSSTQNYPTSGDRYITDQDGVIKMWVNVWGQVNRPGSYLVYDGIDLATLLSITGGPRPGANLSNIKLFREIPDENGNISRKINLKKFLRTGDRGQFTKILPNDTFVVPQAFGAYIISNLNIVNTIINFYNLYTIAKLRDEQTSGK